MTLRPSDAHLWVNCPLAGSVMSSGEYFATPDPENVHTGQTDEQREGICAHWAAEMVLTESVQNADELLGVAHANGWIVDEEMVRHVNDYAEYVRSFGRVVASEQPVKLFGLINGRVDTVTSSNEAVIRVFDFKYGWRIIEAEENYAMLCYGIALAAGREVKLELHIFQPRPNHPDGHARIWEIEAHDVAVWSMWLEDRAQECFSDPRGKPGSHCTKCPARGSCFALTKNVFAAYEIIGDDRMSNHSPAELGAFLTFLHTAADMVKAKLSGIEAETTARINRGTAIPKWAIEDRLGNRRFTVSEEQVRLFTGVNPVKTVQMSPAELEKAGIPKDIVNMIAERPVIGRRLTNNPEAIAKRLFGK